MNLENEAQKSYISHAMYLQLRTFLSLIGALGIAAGVVYFLTATLTTAPAEQAEPQAESVIVPVDETNLPNVSSGEESSTMSESKDEIATRIENPYPFPPESFDVLQNQVRSALVNIFCASEGGIVRPSSGSGVLIDSRGVILTNAHVAQYVLLAEHGRTDLSCVVRTGSPARPAWHVSVLYLPPVWIEEHAEDILAAEPTETGEHDYALLLLTQPILPHVPVSSIPYDTREGIGFTGDDVLVASYPAEFIHASGIIADLNPISSIAPIRELLTFSERSIDLVSIGGISGAQRGSSGGPVINAWGQLIGIITTTSNGVTIAERDLHVLTLSYIDRDLRLQNGTSLTGLIADDVAQQAAKFRRTEAPALLERLENAIVGTSL